MTPENASPASADTDRGHGTADRKTEHTATARSAQPRKWQRVLLAFLDRGQQGWNRFESARELRDHVLPTTVSQLEQRGIKILRRDETLPGYYGPVTCSRYWLDPASVARARELIGAAP